MRVLPVLLLVVSCAFAQAPDNSVPAPSNVYGKQYPRIHRDGRVTFQIKLPNAKTVAVAGRGADGGMNGNKPYPMTRSEDGTWTVTTDPVRPGFHYYELIVDGTKMTDPSSETFFGWAQQTSGLEVPDPALSFYETKPVPHGEVVMHLYQSGTTGQFREVYVYTPPEYRTNRNSRFPVLYLQHGSGENERGWTRQGKANLILDNLLAEKKIKPMIVVMEKGYAAKPGADNTQAFRDLVVNDLVPEIDRSFRTIANRDSRAVAGLSMGAGQALSIGLANVDKFAYIGAFSGGVQALRNLNKEIPSLRLLWIGYGVEDGGYAGAKQAHESLEKAGVKHVWFEGPGSHEWQVWRKHLHAFAPLLFTK